MALGVRDGVTTLEYHFCGVFIQFLIKREKAAG